MNTILKEQLRVAKLENRIVEKLIEVNILPKDFNPENYRELNKDLVNLNEDELILHYLKYGALEQRSYKKPLSLNQFLSNNYSQETILKISSLIESVKHAGVSKIYKREELKNLRFRLQKILTTKPIEKTPKVSVIIPVFNQIIFTATCVISLFESNPNYSFELIIADDCSTDETKVFFADLDPHIKIVKTINNSGFIKNCNNAAKSASGEFIIFLNNDTIVFPGWLDELIEPFSTLYKCGIVGSKLLNIDGSLQEAGGIYWINGSAGNYGRNSNPDGPDFNFVRSVDYCSGASICISRILWENLNGFDEIYKRAYCEDADLSFRSRQKYGMLTYYNPFSVILHHEGASSGKDITQNEKSYQHINQKIFFQRWEKVLKMEHEPHGKHVFGARSRLNNKKTVLVADRSVLKPDYDAGSRSTYHIIKLLCQKGFHVIYWSHDRSYDKLYAQWLQRLGVQVVYIPHQFITFERWFQHYASYIDAVILNRPHVANSLLPVIKRFSKVKTYFYGHDIHHLRLKMELKKNSNNNILLKRYRASLEQEVNLWKNFDIVLYPSPTEVQYVKNQLSTQNCETEVRLLPVYAFENFNETAEKNLKYRNGIIFVAGFSHQPNVEAAIWFAKNVWTIIKQSNPNTTLSYVGSSPPLEIQNLINEGINVTGYITDSELELFYKNSRVAIAPLLVGAGMKGKVVESLKNGLPIVTTTVGAQGLENYGNILDICDNPVEMSQRISKLLTDDELWKQRSKDSLELAKKHFSIESMWTPLSDIV